MEVVKNEIAGYQQEIDAGLITEEGVSRVMKSENDLLDTFLTGDIQSEFCQLMK